VRKRQRLLVASASLTVAALAATVLTATLTTSPAAAHGAMQVIGSRTWLCYEDAITSTGEIVPKNSACQAAVAKSGTTPLYNWFAVGNRSGATSGGTVGFIPDGKLCSGNSNYYDFSGFDIVSPNWPKTHLTAGSTIQIRYNKWAAHPGTFSLYMTKPTWDPTQPLAWSEINLTPFSTATNPPSVGSPGSVDSYYYWNATLPAGYTGDQIIYSVWARSDSPETFYGCSDVVFDGGNGNVTGLGASGPPPKPTPCNVSYAVTTTWPGGFQAAVTVKNPTTATLYGWTVSWVMPDGEDIASSWNGTLSRSGSLATVKNANWNSVLGPGATASFGFVATYSGTPSAPTSISCESP